jgi:hypothetical protein
VFGMSCARVCPVEVLCAGACVYNEIDAPAIEIGKLQRYATDAAFAAGWEFFTAGPDTGKSVGIVGGGPAALAAAHELRRLGHACTIYDAGGALGGLNTTGVAPYKMRADQSLAEVEWVLRIGGIEVQSGVQVGREVTWETLRSATRRSSSRSGSGSTARWTSPASSSRGSTGRSNSSARSSSAASTLASVRSAVVLGGGNTAVDAVRELLGLGVPEVTMIYRGTEAQMSGYVHEWKAAKVEGVRAVAGPAARVCRRDGQVSGVRCARLGDDRKPTGEEFDGAGRRRAAGDRPGPPRRVRGGAAGRAGRGRAHPRRRRGGDGSTGGVRRRRLRERGQRGGQRRRRGQARRSGDRPHAAREDRTMTTQRVSPDLRSNTGGIVTPNPFWLASAPPTNSGGQISRAFDAGWGGAVWKTLGSPIQNVSSRFGGLHYKNTRAIGFNNIELITDRPLEVNLREIYEVKKRYPKHGVIVSLMVESRDEWRDIIKRRSTRGPTGSSSTSAARTGCASAAWARRSARSRRSTRRSRRGRSSTRRCRCW